MDSLGLCIINGHCRGFLGPCVGRVTCTSLPLAKMITLFVAKAIRCAQIIAKSLEKLKPQEMKEKPKKTVEGARRDGEAVAGLEGDQWHRCLVLEVSWIPSEQRWRRHVSAGPREEMETGGVA
uniref:Uncharacterized protein n=1 Tax=Oryza nivara TaxID=4536 RepID=A0A0E0G5H1_ORYNI